VVPFQAGGSADLLARIVQQHMEADFHTPFIVENRSGAGGSVGTAYVAKAAPDGYTLLLGSIGPLAVHQYTYQRLPFNPERDFVPIALLESSPILLVASAKSSVSTAADVLQSKSGSLSYASNGNGSPEQVAGELFKVRSKVDIAHLPYDGAGSARKAVLAGEAALMFDPCKGALPAIHQGLQKPLAVAAPRRLADLPQVPTFAEIGIPHYDLRIWTGVLAPTGTPRRIVTMLNKAVQEIVHSPDIRKEIADEGGEPGMTTSSERFAEFIKTERTHWRALVRESGVTKVL
jgi:tripartite-type tricarboxylate transporter receptor subunit TctC